MDISGALSRKYQIQQEQADTASRLANANVGYLGAQTAAYPEEAASRAFATRAGGQTSLAQAQLFGVNAGLAPWLASSEVNERNAAAGQSAAQAGLTRYQTAYNPDLTQLATDRAYGPTAAGGSQGPAADVRYSTPGVINVGGASPALGSSLSPPIAGGAPPRPNFGFSGGNEGNIIGGNPLASNAYSQGTDKVPGKGDGKTDTQPAMLAPGEAVLNKGAAEHLGRDTISLLNAIGARRMGLTVGDDSDQSHPNTGSNAGVDNQTGAPTSGPHYAEGTSYTPGYAWGDANPNPPAPGQTITSGTWGSPQTPTDTGSNSGIRALIGLPGKPRVVTPKPGQKAENDDASGVQSFAKGTSNVKARGGKGKGGGKMSPHAAAHTPDGSGISPGIIEALMSMGGMGGAGAPGGMAGGGGGGMPAPQGPVGLGMPPAGGAGMAPVSLPPLKKKAA